MAPSSAPAVRIVAALLSSLPLLAQSPQWHELPALGAPPARTGFTLASLPDGRVLLFGGDTGNPAATEWAWDGIAWSPVVTPVPRRVAAAIGRDASNGSLLLFGGIGPQQTLLADTWQFANGVWTQLSPPSSPSFLAHTSIAFDPRDGGMLLVGRSAGNLQTWRFANGTWTSVTSQVPFPFSRAWIVTDTVRGEPLLFTGEPGRMLAQRLVSDVWVFAGDVAPNTIAVPWAAFDTGRGRAVVAGPASIGGFGTYEFDGLGFTASPATPGPNVTLDAAAVAYHGVRKETVLVEGASGGTLRVWRWAPNPQPLATAYGGPCFDPLLTLALAPGDVPQPGAAHRLQASGGPVGSFLTVALLGMSHVQASGVPLPLPIPAVPGTCLLRVEPLVPVLLGGGLPATLFFAVPNSPVLLGTRYDAQIVTVDANGIRDTSNGLEVQIGQPIVDSAIVESFQSAANRDAIASGDNWSGGVVTPVAIGGDGRHGSFDPTLGTPVGQNVFVWNTDTQLIPGSATLSGQPATVTDGRFYFTDFVVPSGLTVRFVGSVPAQVFVRGRAEIVGVLDLSGADMSFFIPPAGPAAGERVSTFDARGSFTTPLPLIPGQPGGAPGAGGGRGGNGGNEGDDLGPDPQFSGQDGEDVRVAAGHAYAASAAGTRGRGGVQFPASGIAQSFPLLLNIHRDEFCPGGSGGGFRLAGTSSSAALLGATIGPSPAPGSDFSLFPYPAVAPPGYQALDHFVVGGSGGGGGGSHGFGTVVLPADKWMAGHGGSGGGGACAIRAGGDLVVRPGAWLLARGGAGVLINGDDPATPFAQENTFGISSPGGGGAGGSFLLQSGRLVTMAGSIDASGGSGSRTGSIDPPQLSVLAQAGAGSPGTYRLEGALGVQFTGGGLPLFQPIEHVGALLDRDTRTGSRSTWYLPPAPGLPYYLRYELVVDVGGATVLYSDDPDVAPLAANDPNGPALLRFQGARIDTLTGTVAPGTIGPWRTTLVPGADSLNRDRATTVRFDLVLNKALGPVSVRELRFYWR